MRFLPRPIGFLVLPILASLLVGGCTGGGKKSSAVVVLSGRVGFVWYQPLSPGGLDYAHPINAPIRGAVVQLRDDQGKVVAETISDAGGQYQFPRAPAKAQLSIVVRAELREGSAVWCRVQDNTRNAAVYAMTTRVNLPATGSLQVNLLAASGWNSEQRAYTSERVAGPFALLDVAWQVRQTLRTVESRPFPVPLMINWSTANEPSSGDISSGRIGTSYFDGHGQIFVLGKADDDTDEYDQHVVSHEISHYINRWFGADDTLGGSHGGDDLLDPTVAMSEGLANALSGIFLEDPKYIDTQGFRQARAGVVIDLDADAVADGEIAAANDPFTGTRRYDGAWSEISVGEVLWDLYDARSADDDPAALGFGPLWAALTGQQDTPAFTTIYSFLAILKANQPGQAATITTIAAAENILDGDAFQETQRPFYVLVPSDGTMIVDDGRQHVLQTYANYGFYNKLLNRMFFVSDPAEVDGLHVLTISPISTAGVLDVYVPGLSQYWAGRTGQPTTVNLSLRTGARVVFAVGSPGSNCTSFTVTLSPPATVPAADG